jgi:hypothetical protein
MTLALLFALSRARIPSQLRLTALVSVVAVAALLSGCCQ